MVQFNGSPNRLAIWPVPGGTLRRPPCLPSSGPANGHQPVSIARRTPTIANWLPSSPCAWIRGILRYPLSRFWCGFRRSGYRGRVDSADHYGGIWDPGPACAEHPGVAGLPRHRRDPIHDYVVFSNWRLDLDYDCLGRMVSPRCDWLGPSLEHCRGKVQGSRAVPFVAGHSMHRAAGRDPAWRNRGGRRGRGF